MRITPTLCAAAALCVSSMALAGSPFDGSWRLNQAKSQIASDTLSFTDGGDGTLKYADNSESFSFKPDGSPFTSPSGTQRTFRRNTDGTYTSTATLRGVPLGRVTWNVSADGKTLMTEVRGTKPNGDWFDDTETYVRSSPGTGLVGAWKSTQVKLSSPNTITFLTNGEDLTLTVSAIKATCHGKWDGKDYPATGPTIPDGLTVSLTTEGPDGFKLVQKLKGKALDVSHFRIASDGKSMTAKGTDGEGKEPYTEVFDKQS